MSKNVLSHRRASADIEPLSGSQVRRLENLYQKATMLRNAASRSRRPANAYISDIVNVRSLLNIRPFQPEKTDVGPYNDRIIINVCGDRYETYRATLERYPQSLLGNPRKRKRYYDTKRNEYFFDRNRSCFQAILYYYQSSGRLRRPNYVSLDIFLEEVAFFQLGQEAMDQIRRDENIEEVEKVRLPKNRFRRYLWATLEYPEYSRLAKVVNIISLLLILLSTIALAIESLPQYINLDDLYCQPEINKNNVTNDSTATSNGSFYVCYIYFTSPFFLIQTICVGFFTIEILLRLITTPSLWIFVKNVMNWIDLLAVVPYYVSLGIRLSGGQSQIDESTYTGLRLLRIIRFGRVFKFYRIFKRLKSFRVLVITIKQSLPDFTITIVILTLLAFLFGSAAYFAENEANGSVFDSIPKATYWGVMTIASVGFGDMAPITPMGRIIACVCALCGASTIGVLVSVLVDRYQRVYARKLYVNEEPIDFEDHSEESENEEIELRIEDDSIPIPEVRGSMPITGMNVQRSHSLPAPGTYTTDEQLDRLYFILGYVIDPRDEVSDECFEKIQSILIEKHEYGFDFYFHRIASDPVPESNEVKFEISSTGSEDNNEDLEEDGDAFTEIATGCHGRGNVLKTFYRRPSGPNPNNQEQECYF